MSGVKGRSGRRPLRDEQKRLRIIDKAWETVETFLNDTNVPIRLRAECAIKVVQKDMPTDALVNINNEIKEYLVIHKSDGTDAKKTNAIAEARRSDFLESS